jgi:Holliday junction resolvase
MDKIILSFDKEAFEFAQSMHTEKLTFIKNIEAVAKKELDLTIDVTDSITLKDEIYKAVEAKYKKENLLKLTGEKLVELMQLDLKPIFEVARIFHNYDAVDKDNTPTKEQFTLTVDNDAELERYNHALKVIELIDETRKLTNDVSHIKNYLLPFGKVIKLNSTFEGLEPLPSFVKS